MVVAQWNPPPQMQLVYSIHKITLTASPSRRNEYGLQDNTSHASVVALDTVDMDFLTKFELLAGFLVLVQLELPKLLRLGSRHPE